MKKIFLAMMTTGLLQCAALHAAPPAPYGPVPTPRQLAWQELEFIGFLHFTVNTFTDKEWGYGDEAESVFNPTAFDAEQIVGAAAAGGMKELILTCKHHDGFCLWPSKFTEHSVKNSTWKNGKGDVVREISDACKRHGIKFGVYLSPWDRNHKDYATPAYITYFRNQLRELLTNYGPIYEVWFDGANGGDGFYGGAKEKRKIDNKTYYDWPNTIQLVRDLQPLACMFSDGGPDVRWVGNERGIAGETCWATLNRDEFMPGNADPKRLNRGDRPGTHWLPAECDVSIRPGWFYHATQDDKVRSPENLLDLYFASVGRGAVFLLNLPPDRRGLIHENDVKSLQGFHKLVDATFAKDFARGATARASSERRDCPASNVNDGKRDTFWASDDNVTTPELVLDLGATVTFNVVRLREHLPLGQRVEAFALDAWKNGAWIEFASGTSIGSCRLTRGAGVTTDKVRLRVTQSPVCPAISEVGLFFCPVEQTAATVPLDVTASGYTIRMDASEAPEMAAWAAKVQREVSAMYPKICAALSGNGFKPPQTVSITIKRNMKGVAATGGAKIGLAATWFKDHPDDIGAVMHELTHVAQSWPKYDPVWLCEGIADYVRFWMYEPVANRPKLNFERDNPRKSYRVTAAFLAYAQEKYDKELVKKINAACRDGVYTDDLFRQLCGKNIDEIWDEMKRVVSSR